MASAQGPPAVGHGDSCQAIVGERQFRGTATGSGAGSVASAREEGQGAAARAALAVVATYKRFLSPFLPKACRFSPTCSEYARLAILKHGFARGSWKALGRILRCHPFHPGGVDLP